MDSFSPRYTFCGQMADKVLKKHRPLSPPVNVHQIVRLEGFEVAYFDWPTGREGLLDPASRRIGLNRNVAPTRLRFTLAHELGHAILNHNGVSDSPPDIDHPPEESAALYPKHLEQEADAFGGCLLVPKMLLREAVRVHRTPKALAAAFDVSEAVICIRLKITNLLRALV
jgi:Zn-dependent peptidase ImmA (M78 family)